MQVPIDFRIVTLEQIAAPSDFQPHKPAVDPFQSTHAEPQDSKRAGYLPSDQNQTGFAIRVPFLDGSAFLRRRY